MLPRGGRSGGSRYLDARHGLFWLGALVWLTGLILQLQFLTGVAIAILLIAMVLGLIARRVAERDDVDGSEDEVEDEEGRQP
jgi:membrane protein implicated in regulation of membrane protease activity